MNNKKLLTTQHLRKILNENIKKIFLNETTKNNDIVPSILKILENCKQKSTNPDTLKFNRQHFINDAENTLKECGLNVKHLGFGDGRLAFLINNAIVLKISYNRFGLKENKHEWTVFKRVGGNKVANIIAYDDDDEYLLEEKLTNVEKNQYSPQFLFNYFYELIEKKTDRLL